MKATLKIKKKMAKKVTTKFGEKTKFSFLVESGKGKSFYVDVWENPKTKEWNEGDEVDMEVTAREYQGKTYWDGKPYEVSINEVYALLQEVHTLLCDTNQSVLDIRDGTPKSVVHKVGEVYPGDAPLIDLAPPHSDEDLRPDEEEGLPF